MLITIGNGTFSIEEISGYVEIALECLVLVELFLPYDNTRRHGNTSGRLEIVIASSSPTSAN